MYDMSEKICLVIPCFNESERLGIEEIIKFSSKYYFLFVNDGSKDNTLDILKNISHENIFILDLPRNLGKAEAIRRGFLYLKEIPIYNELDWIGFWDADLATPLYEVQNFLIFAKSFNPNAKAIFGSRVRRLGSKIIRYPKRHYFGRMFATMVNLIFNVIVYDPQCGAKLFKKELIEKYFNEQFISSWIFDVEIILRMREEYIIEYPLLEWRDIKGGTLKISSVVFRVLKDIIKLIRRYKFNVKGY